MLKSWDYISESNICKKTLLGWLRELDTVNHLLL